MNIPIQEYLSASYDPDVEYVDGVLVVSPKFPQVYALPGLTSQMTATRYRIPDVSVLLALPRTKYLVDAAFLAIEILGDPRLELTRDEIFQDLE